MLANMFEDRCSEHVIVGAHLEIKYKRLASIGFIIEMICEATHYPFDVVVFIN